MDKKTIKETLLKGERVTLECKRAKAEVPDHKGGVRGIPSKQKY